MEDIHSDHKKRRAELEATPMDPFSVMTVCLLYFMIMSPFPAEAG
jgi:hypothetical protein